MNRDRRKHKGRSERGSFFAWPREVAESIAYVTASAHGKALLNDLCFQFRGSNNGDLSAAWAIMKVRGWKSRDTLTRALAELLERGLIEKTRQGGRHRCSLYALTWLPINECCGKLDVSATRVPSGLWKQPKPMPEQKNGNTVGVSHWPGRRVNPRSTAAQLTRQAC